MAGRQLVYRRRVGDGRITGDIVAACTLAFMERFIGFFQQLKDITDFIRIGGYTDTDLGADALAIDLERGVLDGVAQTLTGFLRATGGPLRQESHKLVIAKTTDDV